MRWRVRSPVSGRNVARQVRAVFLLAVEFVGDVRARSAEKPASRSPSGENRLAGKAQHRPFGLAARAPHRKARKSPCARPASAGERNLPFLQRSAAEKDRIDRLAGKIRPTAPSSRSAMARKYRTGCRQHRWPRNQPRPDFSSSSSMGQPFAVRQGPSRTSLRLRAKNLALRG